MKQPILYEKLSKKEQKKINTKRRRFWSDYGCASPATKIIPDKRKEHHRRRCRNHTDNL